MRGARLFAAFAIATLGGQSCADAAAFACRDDAQCEGGVCTDAGYCAFDDEACASGLRYGDHAGDDLAGQCVPEVIAGTTGAVVDAETDTGEPAPEGSTGGLDDATTTSSIDESGDGEASTTGPPACAEWWDEEWTRRRAMLVSARAALVTAKFPTALRVGDDLPGDLLSASGAEVRFVDDHCVQLPHEIEFSAEGDPLVIWVGMPIDQRSVVHMYYGNPAAQDGQRATDVWDDDFFGVWHLANLGDASGQMHTLEPAPEAIEGPLGLAGYFDGVDDFTQVPAALGFNVTGAAGISVSAWIRLDAAPTPGETVRIIDKADALDAGLGFSFSIRVDGTVAELEFDRGLPGGELAFSTEGTEIVLGQWHHVGATFNGDQPTTFFVDGVALPSVITAPGTAEPQADDSIPITIGAAPYSGTRFFEGGIDEVRVSGVMRSDAWMAAEHAAGIGTLVSVGPEEAQ